MKQIGFGIKSVIVIILLTSIVSALTMGVIINNNYKVYNYTEDKDLKEFLKVYGTLTNEYYEYINKSKMIDSAIEGMLDYLDDNYTNYIDKDENQAFQDSLTGKYKVIGIIISDTIINQVIAFSPADKAGLKVGDKILELNDIKIINSFDVNTILNENKSNSLKLKIQRKNQVISFTVEMEELDLPVVNYEMIDDSKIGYIQISLFSSSVEKQFKNSLNVLKQQKLESLIIDLRGNKGGYLKGAVDIASIFLEKGKTIVTLENKDKKRVTTKDETEENFKIPIYILIDEETASASEILTAALVDNNVAKTIGMTSFGKGKVQQTLDLHDGALPKYTTGLWYTPLGKSINEIGITPDYEIELEIITNEKDEIIEIIDTQFNKAVELLK
jgi:carboxyl-terminal processing protease